MTRVRISDRSLVGDFAEFLERSGFVVEAEDGDTLRLRLPLTPGPGRREDDIEVLLAVWVEIGLRIWRDRSPDAEVIVLGDEPARAPAASPALAS